MALHTLPKIVRRKKRVGRGIGGRGAKSGRGMKGQRSRAGSHQKAGFEGGQTPLYMRLPKGRGTKQAFNSQATKPQTVQLSKLTQFKTGSIVGPGQLFKQGLLKQRYLPIKIIGTGMLSKKLTVRVHAASAAARRHIEKAGGKVEIIKETENNKTNKLKS